MQQVDARQMAAAPGRSGQRAGRGRDGGAHARRGRGRGRGAPAHPLAGAPTAAPQPNQATPADAVAAAGQKRGLSEQDGRPAKRQHAGGDTVDLAGDEGVGAATDGEAAGTHENGARSDPAPPTSVPALPAAAERPCAASPVLPARRARRPPLSNAQTQAFLALAGAAGEGAGGAGAGGGDAAPELAASPLAAPAPADAAAAAGCPPGVVTSDAEGAPGMEKGPGGSTASSSMRTDGSGHSVPAARPNTEQKKPVQSPAQLPLPGLGGSSLPPRPLSPHRAAKAPKAEAHREEQPAGSSGAASGLHAAGQRQLGSSAQRCGTPSGVASTERDHMRSAGGREASSNGLAFDPLRLPVQRSPGGLGSPLRKRSLQLKSAREQLGGDLAGASSSEGFTSNAAPEQDTASEPSSTTPAEQAAREGVHPRKLQKRIPPSTPPS